MIITTYDVTEFHFREHLCFLFDVGRLELLHTLVKPLEEVTRENDQAHPLIKQYYKDFSRIEPLYRNFVREVCPRVLTGSGAIIYQRVPTFRIHFPGSLAVGEFHKDSDYGHQPRAVNFWTPLTVALGTSSIWIESIPDKWDYTPAAVDYGEVLVFDGINLRHGNKPNQTGRTRVSFDFRAMRESEYDPSWKGVSINTKQPMLVGEGGYFARMEEPVGT